ncbi:MAG: EAL domain-containing protein [Gammaproteobacteria bacterium]|nr:EAL domain-containing protein [Gammaproteobacteria bacterium]
MERLQDQNLHLYKTQLDLLLLINQGHSIEKIVYGFVPGALELLNCISGHICLFNTDNSKNPQLFSFPSAATQLSENLDNATKHQLLNYAINNLLTEPLRMPTIKDRHNYLFPLTKVGVLLLQSKTEHDLQNLITILKPATEKLAESCAFCLQYNLNEDKYNKIFNESPVSLWEQDLSETEAELKKLQLRGITDIKQYLTNNPHLPLEFLKKLKVINVNQATLDMYEAKSKEEFFAEVENVYDAGVNSRDGLLNAAAAIISGKKGFTFEAITKTLTNKILNVIVRSVVFTSNTGYSYVFSSVQDITAQKQAVARYEYLATHDVLTELPNRRFYENYLKQAINEAEKTNSLLAVLYIDIDYFKKINDSYGHHIGDSLLQEFSSKLKKFFAKDFVARLGGDEFVVVIKNIAIAATAGEVADAAKKHLDTYYKISEHNIDVISSVGIAVYPFAGNNFVDLNKNADIALYSVKNSGRNNYKYFTTDDKYYGLLNLETELNLAIEQKQIFLCYQPIYALKQASIVGLEALARWQHPKFGLIMPQVFISIAEENGSIIPLGYLLLEAACKQYVEWFGVSNKENIIKLKVNISPKQLVHRNFFATTNEIINKTSINPKNLEFELTETAFVQQPELIAKVLSQIQSLGIKLLLDDIGSGYSSLSYLSRFPISAIKIDQSFVRSIPINTKNTAIIQAILQIARDLNLEVIAEGVENKNQVDYLADLGCNVFQGFYFYKPLKTGEIEALLKHVIGSAPIHSGST